MNLQKINDLDHDLSKKISFAEQPGLVRSIAVFLGHTGDSWFWAVALLLVWAFAPEAYASWAWVTLLAVVVTAALVLGIKFTIRRQRPAGELGQIYRKTDPHSFPSGHATRAILLGVIALGLAPAWLGILLIIWGPLVGIARIAMGVHYLSDVLAGWVLGAIIGLLVLQFSDLIPVFLL
ncbi:MAG: phosphatase PAP2 family protein [Chloroflexota bacterium]